MKVVLVGYMASGKTTIGKFLAKSLEIDFIDLDDAIALEVGLSITEIFKTKGELFFRKTEMQVLEKLLTNEQSFVLATGGGTPGYGSNMDSIAKMSSHSVYLKHSIPSLTERIIMEKAERPLVAKRLDDELPEFIGKHLFERSMFYAMATETINCDKKSVEAIANEIKKALR